MKQLLSVRDIRVELGGREIIRGVSASFGDGGLVALVGPNGAGKTTLVKAIVGLLPSDGEIMLDGRPAGALDATQRARRIAYLPQGQTIHWPLPAHDIVALGRYAYGARDPSRLAPADERAVQAAMLATDALSFADRRVTELSGGERARVALARALAGETPILIADEPIAALDPRHQLSAMSLFRTVADEGRLVIVVLHDLSLAWRFADRVLVMREGRLVTDGAPPDALTPAILGDVFGVKPTIIEHGGRSWLAGLEPL